jgi:NADPH:quinone reductase-like Zn-dependent oxidoreductase
MSPSRRSAVTAVTGSPRRAERLLALGAIAAVRDLDEAGGPFDVVLESVGGDSSRAPSACWRRAER